MPKIYTLIPLTGSFLVIMGGTGGIVTPLCCFLLYSREMSTTWMHPHVRLVRSWQLMSSIGLHGRKWPHSHLWLGNLH